MTTSSTPAATTPLGAAARLDALSGADQIPPSRTTARTPWLVQANTPQGAPCSVATELTMDESNPKPY